ncbi:MAG: hypothetical protein WC627_10510 [Legionella sp.]|jgi:hypothetical protein
MKKLLMLALGSLVMTSAQAEVRSCGYKDYFHLSTSTNPGVEIVSGFAESDLDLEFVGPRSFILRDGPYCRSGYAHVTVALDNDNYCILDIKDGPYMMSPTVNGACNGLRYIKTTYDGIGTYSYSIHLE